MENEIDETQAIDSKPQNSNETIDVFSVDTASKNSKTSSGKMKELTPLEEADIAWREEEKRLTTTKIETWERVKKGVYPLYLLIGVLIAILATFWGYKISSIAEPIGSIKTEIEAYKKYKDEEIKPAIDKINEIKIRLEYTGTNTTKQNSR